jgi:hypothetical protein
VSPARLKVVKPPKPWSRAEAGRYVSSDERFTLESDGAGRWFATDAESLDELGLARTIGPFPTLDAAKAGADEARQAGAIESPLAERLGATTRAGKAKGAAATAATPEAARPKPTLVPDPPAEPPPPTRTWLDDLADRDPGLAKRTARLVAALEREGIRDADSLVRRDVLGDRPLIATRLAARDVVAAIARLRNPSQVELAEAVAGALASSPKRGSLPGWELRERDAPGGRDRPLRLTVADLEDAASD